MEFIKNPNFDFIGKRKIMYSFSFVVILFGMIVFGMRGQKNFGVDFIGGDIIRIEFKNKMMVTDIREELKNLNLGNVTVQSLGREENEFIIRSNPDTSEKILSFFKHKFGEESFILKAKSVVSPSMSISLRKKAIRAFLWGVLAIFFYLAIRFEFRFAIGATLAIFHDILVVLSILTLLGKQIDTSVIAALLTIIGYSVNDTVVIFDRIREDLRKTRSDNYQILFNKSINETLSRTLLTLLTTLFVVLCLFFFGGESLHAFSLALLIGFTIGTYSSVFIASSIIIDWNKVKPHIFKL